MENEKEDSTCFGLFSKPKCRVCLCLRSSRFRFLLAKRDLREGMGRKRARKLEAPLQIFCSFSPHALARIPLG